VRIRVLVPLAEGFEEIEAVTIVDVLRRAGAEVVVAGLQPGPIKASRGVVMLADTLLEQAVEEDFHAIVLPGGAEGARRLAAEPLVRKALEKARGGGKLLAAICAAPALVLHPHGFLQGKKATCHPSLAKDLPGYVDERVVSDGRTVTSQGPGTALEFSLELVRQLFGPERRELVSKPMLAPNPVPATPKSP
jgi:4-methyl-5(b-hydroxyethyl)-thiazole monophosphate biosynthesis